MSRPASIAEPARRSYQPALLAELLQTTAISGRELILRSLDEIHARYMDAIDLP